MRALIWGNLVAGSEEIKIFLYGHIAIYAKRIGHEPDDAAHFVRLFMDRISADENFPFIGFE